jgi:major vault protein
MSYRVNFEGEPDKWFNVENYVKFLTDHLRSKIRNFVQKLTIAEFFANPIDILRDIILGKIKEDSNRTGGKFAENGMHIYDVEILNIELLDSEIENLLMQAQHDNVRQKLEIIAQENKFQFTKQSEELNRKIAEEQSISKQKNMELIQQEVEKNLMLTLQKLDAEIKAKQKTLTSRLDEQKQLTEINNSEISREKAKKDMLIQLAESELQQSLVRIKAEVEAVVLKAEAVSPDLIAALQAFGDKALAEKMAQSMAPLSIIGGKSIAEVFANMLKGTVLENVLEAKKK